MSEEGGGSTARACRGGDGRGRRGRRPGASGSALGARGGRRVRATAAALPLQSGQARKTASRARSPGRNLGERAALAPSPRRSTPSAPPQRPLADQSGGAAGLPAPRPHPQPAHRQPMSGRARRPVRAARAEPAQSEKSEPNPSGPPLRTRSHRRLLPPDRVYCPNPKVQFCGPAAASGRDDTGVRQVSEARESGRRGGAALRGRTCSERAGRRPEASRAGGRQARAGGRGPRAAVHSTPPRPLPLSPARLFVRSEPREERPRPRGNSTPEGPPSSSPPRPGGAHSGAHLGLGVPGAVRCGARSGHRQRPRASPPQSPARSASGARWGARRVGTGGLLQVICGLRLVTRRPAGTSKTEM